MTGSPKENKMGTFLSGRLLYIVEWDNIKIDKIEYGTMGNMLTDGVIMP